MAGFVFKMTPQFKGGTMNLSFRSVMKTTIIFLGLTMALFQTGCFDGCYTRCEEYGEDGFNCTTTTYGDTSHSACRPNMKCVQYGEKICPQKDNQINRRVQATNTVGLPQFMKFHSDVILERLVQLDFTVLESLYLTNREMMDLVSGKSISEEKIQKVAAKNGVDTKELTSKVSEVLTSFSTQRKDVSSNFWKTCIAKGKWSTNSNQFCSYLWEPGCSPQSGANLCWHRE